MFRKLKIELTAFLIIFLIIIGFFVAAKVLEVTSHKKTDVAIQSIIGIERELKVANCLASNKSAEECDKITARSLED